VPLRRRASIGDQGVRGIRRQIRITAAQVSRPCHRVEFPVGGENTCFYGSVPFVVWERCKGPLFTFNLCNVTVILEGNRDSGAGVTTKTPDMLISLTGDIILELYGGSDWLSDEDEDGGASSSASVSKRSGSNSLQRGAAHAHEKSNSVRMSPSTLPSAQETPLAAPTKPDVKSRSMEDMLCLSIHGLALSSSIYQV